jgi:hypothetical protein
MDLQPNSPVDFPKNKEQNAMKSHLVICLFLILLIILGLSADICLAQTDWEKHIGNPVLPTGDTGAWDSSSFSSISVIHEDNLYKMWYSGHDGSHHRIGYATSGNGISWSKYDVGEDGNSSNDFVIPLGAANSYDSDAVTGANVLHDNADPQFPYKMWYSGHDGSTYRICLAKGRSETEWEKEGPITPGGLRSFHGGWDNVRVHSPTVIYDEDDQTYPYKMWYTGEGEYGEPSIAARIGYARSEDGITWEPIGLVSTNRDGQITQDGLLDFAGVNYRVMYPMVVYDPADPSAKYKMWYTYRALNVFKIQYATSSDGMVWTKHGSVNPNGMLGEDGDWDSVIVAYPAVIKEINRYHMWYTSVGGIGYADSPPSQYPKGMIDEVVHKNEEFLESSAPGETIEFEIRVINTGVVSWSKYQISLLLNNPSSEDNNEFIDSVVKEIDEIIGPGELSSITIPYQIPESWQYGAREFPVTAVLQICDDKGDMYFGESIPYHISIHFNVLPVAKYNWSQDGFRGMIHGPIIILETAIHIKTLGLSYIASYIASLVGVNWSVDRIIDYALDQLGVPEHVVLCIKYTKNTTEFGEDNVLYLLEPYSQNIELGYPTRLFCELQDFEGSEVQTPKVGVLLEEPQKYEPPIPNIWTNEIKDYKTLDAAHYKMEYNDPGVDDTIFFHTVGVVDSYIQQREEGLDDLTTYIVLKQFEVNDDLDFVLVKVSESYPKIGSIIHVGGKTKMLEDFARIGIGGMKSKAMEFLYPAFTNIIAGQTTEQPTWEHKLLEICDINPPDGDYDGICVLWPDEGALAVQGGCPIDLIVSDPSGRVISKISSDIPSSIYTEWDLNGDDDPDDRIIISEPTLGEYHISVIPESDALPTDTYSLSCIMNNEVVILAENVQISSIPQSPYIFNTVQTENKTASIAITPITWYTHWQDDPRGYIRAYIGDIQDGREVTDIDISTLKLYDSVPASSRYRIKESQPGFTGNVLEVMFGRHDAILTLGDITAGDTKEISVSGEFTDGASFDGTTNVTIATMQAAPAKPAEFALLQNFSNPFNPETWIPYQLAEDVDVTIRIYNITGQLIRTLDLGHKSAGFYSAREKAAYWDGKNEAGESVSSGLYFYTIQAGKFTASRKMIVRR